jgi:hypothetical protein
VEFLLVMAKIINNLQQNFYLPSAMPDKTDSLSFTFLSGSRSIELLIFFSCKKYPIKFYKIPPLCPQQECFIRPNFKNFESALRENLIYF